MILIETQLARRYNPKAREKREMYDLHRDWMKLNRPSLDGRCCTVMQ
jgi:hypothetical protein